MQQERNHPMKQSPRKASSQFTLAFQREPGPHLDEPSKEELLKVLAELMIEALGVEPAEDQDGKEESDEL
jgi:hypothetical protein